MSTPTSIKSQLHALVELANSTTGNSDATVTDAVQHLVDGYGKGGATPTGTLEINSNGMHNVSGFEYAKVDVPSTTAPPSGSLTISENGTYDVTDYASAVVNVEQVSGRITVVRTVTITSDLIGASGYFPALIEGDAFVQEHYADDGFFITMRPITPTSGAYAIVGLYHGNRKLLSTSAWYGFAVMGSADGSTTNFFGNTAPVNGTSYNGGFRVNSTGRIQLVLPANRNLKAGTYELILTRTSNQTLASHSITYELHNVNISDMRDAVADGASYSTEVWASNAHAFNFNLVRVTMGGEDITDSAVTPNNYGDGVFINIPAVTGDIHICAEAYIEN